MKSALELLGLASPPPPPKSTMLGFEVDYCSVYVCFVVLFYCIEQYLRVRKAAALSKGYDAKRLKGIAEKKEYEDAAAYTSEKNKFGFISDTIGITMTMAMLIVAPLLWTRSAELSDRSSFGLYATIFFFTLISTAISFVLGLPLSMYSTFVIEEKYGFNNYTVKSYFSDKIKGELVNLVIGTAMSCGMVKILQITGPNAWFFLWIFLTGFVFFFNLAYPVLIAPLFNTFTPLEEGDVRDGIESLIKKTGLNCKKVFMVDGSKQSKHSNAYVAGMLGTKRIVVYDTLIKDLDGSIDKINAVVGHEIGHSIMNHNWVLLGAALVNLFIMFFTFGKFQNDHNIVMSFGYDQANEFLILTCFMNVYGTVIMPLWGVITNAMTRRLEFDADQYSAKLGMDIRPALIDISKSNKGDLNPDWLNSMWHHSHPPLLERLDAVTEFLKKKK